MSTKRGQSEQRIAPLSKAVTPMHPLRNTRPNFSGSAIAFSMGRTSAMPSIEKTAEP